MKKDIHPPYKKLTIIMPDGTAIDTKSAYTKGELRVDVDFRKHQAWSGKATQLNSMASKVAKFNDRFSGISFSTINKKDTKTKN